MQTSGKLAKAASLVIKVTHSLTQNSFALKRICREDYLQHISDINELFITKKCSSHPNIIQIHGFSIEHKKANGVNTYSTNIVMELWDRNFAEELTIRLLKSFYFTKQQFIQILKTLIATFCHLQKQGIAHRDIKPENIMIKKNGDLCIIDFSEAIWLNKETKFEATTLVGSPYYMSPELKEFYLNEGYSPIDVYDPWKSDVFSLGMTLADIGTLCVGDQKKLKEKMDIIGNNYGEKVRNVLEEMIEKDPKKRKDFLTLESSINFEEISM